MINSGTQLLQFEPRIHHVQQLSVDTLNFNIILLYVCKTLIFCGTQIYPYMVSISIKGRDHKSKISKPLTQPE